MSDISYYDRQIAERKAERNQAHQTAIEHEFDVSDGQPPVIGGQGWLMIVGGIVGTVMSGGVAWPFGLLFVVGGLLFLVGGKQDEQYIKDLNHAVNKEPSAINAVAAKGILGGCVFGIVVMVVVGGLFMLMADAGLIAGMVTR
jgi:hypothetical protein